MGSEMCIRDRDSASLDQDHGGVTFLSQPAQGVSNTIPIASPRYGKSRNPTGHSQRHSKSVSFVDKPKRRSPAVPPITNETPTPFDGYASGSVE